MNTIIAAQMISYGTPGAPNPTSVRQGAYQTPFTKALSQNTAAVFPAELKPVTTVKVASQGSTDQFVIFSHYGPCPLVPDNNNTPGMTPYSTTQMRDDFNLPIAGAPAPGQKALMFQTAAGNPIALGTTSTSPDGITSPQIPNTGDVTPGTAAANTGAVASGPVTKQHPWITDVVTGHGLMQTAYGKYDYTDPTGTVHTSLSKGDKKVKKPKLDVKLSTNTTAPYLLSVAVPGLIPTQYPDSGMDFSLVADGGNDGIRNRTKWGTGVDAENYTDLKIRTSPTLPAMGTGDQTARAFPCYDGTVYNTSAIDYDPITGAAYIKIDGVKVIQDATGALTTAGGGGGGGGAPGTGAANYTIDSNFNPMSGWSSVNYLPWNECINGSNVYLDIANPDGLTIPADGGGDYWISTTLRVDVFKSFLSSNNWSVEYDLSVELWRGGVQITYTDKQDLYQNTMNSPDDQFWADIQIETGVVVPATLPGDVIKVGLQLHGGGWASSGADFYVWGGWAGDATTPDPTRSWLTWVSIAPTGASGAVAFSVQGAETAVAVSTAYPATGDLTWSSVSTDDGGWVTAGTDATGPTVVFPATGTYCISVSLDGDTNLANTGEFQIRLYKNGTNFYELAFPIDDTNGVDSVNGSILKINTFTAGDTLSVEIHNSSNEGINIDAGSVDIWKV